MLESPAIDSSITASIANVKRYAPPNQRNRSLGRRKSGGGTIIDKGEVPEFYVQNFSKFTLGLDHMFSSPIFLGSLAILGASLMACTNTPQIPLLKVARRQPFLNSAEPIQKQEDADTLPRASVEDSGVTSMEVGYENKLGKKRFTLRIERNNSSVAIVKKGETCWGITYKITKKEDQEVALTDESCYILGQIIDQIVLHLTSFNNQSIVVVMQLIKAHKF